MAVTASGIFIARVCVNQSPKPRAKKSMAKVTTKATIFIRVTKKALIAPATIPTNKAAIKLSPEGLSVVDHFTRDRDGHKHHATKH